MPETEYKPPAAVRALNYSVTKLPSEGSGKDVLTRILENRWFDMFILFLVLCDLAAVVTEMSIDHHILCIGGVKVAVSPHEVVEQVSLPLAGIEETEEEGEEEQEAQEAVNLLGSARRNHASKTNNVSPRAPYVETVHRRPRAVIIGTDSQQTVVNPESWSLRHPQRSSHSLLQISHVHSKPSKPKSRALLHRLQSLLSLSEEEEEEAWVCEGREGPKSETIAAVCHYASVGILVFFFLEQIMKIYVAGKHYFENPLHILDFVVITVSLLLDVIITPIIESHGWDNSPEDILMILLVMLRCWRFVRIVHGINEIMEKREESLQEKIDELEKELAKTH